MPPRRTGTENSKTRFYLLDVTERLMLDEGYAAVTSRRVAKEAGVTPPLVHYYFPGLDDLFLAVFRRRADEQLERQARFLAADDPLQSLWAFSTDPRAAAFTNEFVALANHRKSIRAELAASVERFRTAQVEALTEAAAAGRVDLRGISPAGLVVLLTNAARGIVVERDLGLTTGHDDAVAYLDTFLRLTPAPTPSPRTRTRATATKPTPKAKTKPKPKPKGPGRPA